MPAQPPVGYKVVVGRLWVALGSEAAARRLIRRAVMPWAVVELGGTGVLLVERPFLGTTVIAIAASLFAQNRFTRRRA